MSVLTKEQVAYTQGKFDHSVPLDRYIEGDLLDTIADRDAQLAAAQQEFAEYRKLMTENLEQAMDERDAARQRIETLTKALRKIKNLPLHTVLMYGSEGQCGHCIARKALAETSAAMQAMNFDDRLKSLLHEASQDDLWVMQVVASVSAKRSTSDDEFYESLKARLPAGSPIPLFRNADGSLNREKILALPCFHDGNRAASHPQETEGEK